jgi:hypothetical protein
MKFDKTTCKLSPPGSGRLIFIQHTGIESLGSSLSDWKNCKMKSRHSASFSQNVFLRFRSGMYEGVYLFALAIVIPSQFVLPCHQSLRSKFLMVDL